MNEKRKKHEGYQNYLSEIKEGYGLKGLFHKIAKKNPHTLKIYQRLTNISVKKLNDIPNIYQAKNILDIGCGSGDLIGYIKNYINDEANFYGIDLEKNSQLLDFINFSNCDIDEMALPFPENSFDTVISSFVIEHLKNPQNLFNQAYKVLKKDGYFYCITENYISLFCPNYWNFYSDPTHVRPWTKRSLKTLAKMAGFEIYKVGVIRWWEFLPLLPLFPFLNLLSKSNFSFIPFELLGRTVYIIARKQ